MSTLTTIVTLLRSRLIIPTVLSVALIAGACGGSDGSTADEQGADLDRQAEPAGETGGEAASDAAPRPAPGDSSEQADAREQADEDASASSPLASQVVALPPATVGAPTIEPDGPQPIGLSIEALGITTAPVLGVGIRTDGDMEVPPADEVGWYEYGPAPGETGSSVLAAHIAFDGQDGVFVNLDELAVGATITVSYDDGSTADFVAVAKEQYGKRELPKDDIFARDGEPQLVLITCGGEFNRQVRSYEDNVVVYAEPV